LGRRAENAVKRSHRLIGQASLLVVAISVGGFLRIADLGEPCYWLDEILGEILTTQAAAQPSSHWLTGLDREHGPAYYALQLASRTAGSGEAAGRAPAAILGMLTIPLVWLAARAAGNRAALVSSFLFAVSPLHVYYSREARPYALLMFLTAAFVAAVLHEARPHITVLIVIAMLYTSATAAPVIAAAAIAAALAALLAGRGRRDWIVAGTSSIGVLLIPLLYRGSPWKAARDSFPGFDVELASSIVRGLSVSALGSPMNGRVAGALFIAAVAGAIALVRINRRAGVILISMTLVPAVAAVASLGWFGHWFAIRYVAPSLIGFLILAGVGIVAVCDSVSRPLVARWPRAARALATGLALATVLAVAVKVVPVARREAFQKLDWRAIARLLESRAKQGDVILTAEPYSFVSLRHYLHLPPNMHLVLLDLPEVGEKWLAQSRAGWLVTAGYSTPVSSWMCRYPLVLASPLEGFRMHYAPSPSHFLSMRSTPAEQRAISEALGARGFTLTLGAEDNVFLGEGWADPDVARWGTGRHSTLIFPRGEKADRVIRFHAYPITHASLPAQTMRVTLNGATVDTITLAPEWRDYALQAPAKLWIEGLNTLSFDFGRATAPSAVDPSSSDHRELSTAFGRISIDDVGLMRRQESPAPRGLTIRAAADRFLDAPTAWRNTPTRMPAAKLRRETVEPLLARLGFDPIKAWPRLASGDVRLDNVVETIAYGGDCEDHSTFLRRAFAILLMRAPTSGEEKDLLERLAADPSRVAVIGRIVKSEEFRGQVLAH
jgi:hypothetical protein